MSAHATFKEKNLKKWNKTLNLRKQACASDPHTDTLAAGDASHTLHKTKTSLESPQPSLEKDENCGEKTESSSPVVKVTSLTSRDVTPYFVDVLDDECEDDDNASRQAVAYDDIGMFDDGSTSVASVTSPRQKRNKKKKKQQSSMPSHLPAHMRKYWMQRYRLFSRFDQGIKMDTGACVTSCARSLGQTQSTSTCSESGGTSESNRATVAVSSSRTSV